jgi:hypothetical protein
VVGGAVVGGAVVGWCSRLWCRRLWCRRRRHRRGGRRAALLAGRVDRPQRGGVEHTGLRNAEFGLQRLDRPGQFLGPHAVDRAGVEAEIGHQTLDVGGRRRQEIGVRAECGAQCCIRRLVEDARGWEAHRGLECGEGRSEFGGVEAVDRTAVEAEEGQRLLDLGDLGRRGVRLLLAADLGEVDVGARHVGDHSVAEDRRGEPTERRVAVLVDGELTGHTVVVDVFTGVQLVETVGVGRAGDATGGDGDDRLGHRCRLPGIDRRGGERQRDRTVVCLRRERHLGGVVVGDQAIEERLVPHRSDQGEPVDDRWVTTGGRDLGGAGCEEGIETDHRRRVEACRHEARQQQEALVVGDQHGHVGRRCGNLLRGAGEVDPTCVVADHRRRHSGRLERRCETVADRQPVLVGTSDDRDVPRRARGSSVTAGLDGRREVRGGDVIGQGGPEQRHRLLVAGDPRERRRWAACDRVERGDLVADGLGDVGTCRADQCPSTAVDGSLHVRGRFRTGLCGIAGDRQRPLEHTTGLIDVGGGKSDATLLALRRAGEQARRRSEQTDLEALSLQRRLGGLGSRLGRVGHGLGGGAGVVVVATAPGDDHGRGHERTDRSIHLASAHLRSPVRTGCGEHSESRPHRQGCAQT